MDSHGVPTQIATTVKIAGIEFDRVVYDREADVLYLHVGDPSSAVDFDGAPEGHATRSPRRSAPLTVSASHLGGRRPPGLPPPHRR